MRSNQFSKHFFQTDWDTSKTLEQHLLAIVDLAHFLCWCVRARIVLMHNVPSSLVWSSNFSENTTWHTNCGVPLRIDRPTLLKRNSRHMTSFTEETGDPLIPRASSSINFRWLKVVFEDDCRLFCFPHKSFLKDCQIIRDAYTLSLEAT